ncbi:MAG: hypothetical protein IKV55_06600, partial [Oscillospiraceae bacterium]|nr:hypothetical protein [Oscillospiraceae bacterium]
LNLYDFEKAVKNCDYIEVPGPVSGGASGTPYLTWAGVYEKGPAREAYEEFARLHPEYNISVPEGKLILPSSLRSVRRG